MSTSSGATPHKVTIERSGGFAGMKASVQVDVAALTPVQKSALDAVLSAGALRSAPAPASSAGADRFNYRLHITDTSGAVRSVAVCEGDMPDALSRLCKPALP